MKIMVIGDATHGKDTVSKILCELYDLKFVSSSYFCMGLCVRRDLEAQGIFYNSDEECYADRVNHRDKWYNSIARFNKYNPARLGTALFEKFDLYCGNRNPLEFNAMKERNIFDVSFWVDASKRLPPEARTSMGLTKKDADYIIDNNGPLEDLRSNVIIAMSLAMLDGKILRRTPITANQ